MSDLKTALARAFRLSFDGDRRATVTTLLTFGLRPVSGLVIAYLVKVLIDGIGHMGRPATIAAIVGICLVGAVNMSIARFSFEYATRMIEATGASADHALMRVLGRFRLLSDLEQPAVQDELEFLRQERQRLAEGIDSFSLMLGVLIRGLGTAVVLALIDPWLVLTPLFAVPLVVFSQRNAASRAAAIGSAARDFRLARHLYETAVSPAAARELRLLGSSEAIRDRHHSVGTHADRQASVAVMKNMIRTLAGGVIFGFGYVGALLLVLRGYQHGSASIGDVVLVLSLVTGITLQLSVGIRYYAFLQQTMEAALRLHRLEILAADPAGGASSARSAGPPVRLATGIELTGVSYRYPDADGWALKDVNLSIPAGATVLVVGENGAGKTTLIKLLTGLYQPTSGTITVDGEPLDALDGDDWRSMCSAAFQDYVRFEFPVVESVGVGNTAALDDRAAVRRSLAEAGADSFVDALPQGLDTPLGLSFPDGRELSGGQWQRLALARSRMRPAALLVVLDEPTAAIDPVAEAQLLERYLSAARATARASNGIALMASHRLSTGRFADLVVVLREGRLVEVGPHRELLALDGGVYQELYGLQSAAYR